MIRHPQYNLGNIYLSGGMQFAKDLGSEWRVVASERLKVSGFWPIDITQLEKDYRERCNFNITEVLSEATSNAQLKANVRRHFIHADLKIIEEQTDAVLLYYDESVQKGAGTLGEAQYTYNLGKPLFVVRDASLKLPFWLEAMTTRSTSSFEEMFQYLHCLPPNILKTDLYGNYGVDHIYLCNLCGNSFKKRKHAFVSKVTPTFCRDCVEVVVQTREHQPDRYEFIKQRLTELTTE